MAENNNDFEEKANKAFSIERKEDYVVIALATITVILVFTGAIDGNFFSSLFIKY